MGTYICHLRNAEILFAKINNLDAETFLIGNLAPDSGVPNDDWTQFTPPRTVTHFLKRNDRHSNDLEFYQQYLLSTDRHTDNCRYSYLLGYFFHLLCDNLWLLWVVEAFKRDYETVIKSHKEDIWHALKQDWYDLDRRYIRDHSDSKFWRVLKTIEHVPQYLPYLKGKDTLEQIKYIRDIYITSALDRKLARPYLYMSEATMDRFVEDSSSVVLEILSRKDELDQIRHTSSALNLLPAERLRPYARLS